MPKTSWIYLLAGMVVSVGAFSPGRAAEESGVVTLTLTLAEALRIVETDNLEALIGREAIVQAMTVRERERSFLLPQVSLEASQTRNQFVNIGRGFDFGNGEVRQPRPSNRFDAGVTARVPIIDPVAIANHRSARLGLDVSRYDYEQVLQEVLSATANVFLSHLRNLRRFEVIEANIEQGEALLELARNQLDAGVATQIDVTRAEVQLATERQARLQQETVVYQSELLLKRLLDLDLRREVEIADFSVNRYIGDDGPEVDLTAAIEERAEFRRARAQLDRNRLEQRAAGWEHFPAVHGFGDYGYVSERAFQGNGERAWSVGIAMTMPLFDGFRIRSNRNLATSRIRETEMRIRQLRAEVSSELLLSWQDMHSRLAQIEVAEQNLRLVEEEMRLARIRFEQGVADNREIIDAQNRLAIAHDNLIEAVHQFKLSRLDYARGKGDVRLLLGDQAVPRD